MAPDRRRAALAALALLAVAPQARAVDDPCALTVRAEPAELTLGTGERASLRVTGAAGESPRLLASAGLVEALGPDGPESFRATFVPPREAYPQLAIVSVVGSSGCGFAVIRLVGQGDAEVKARPGAAVSVRIGSQLFGPVNADGRGRAVVPVVVPPGVRFGYHGHQAVPLRPPPLRQVALVLDPPGASTDRDAEVRVLAFAATVEGAPWTGGPPQLSASEGTLSGPASAGEGVTSWRWRLPAGRPRVGKITARLPGSDSLPGEAVVELSAGAPARLTLQPARRWVTAGSSVDVTVRSSDLLGNPAEGEPRIELSLGSLGALERSGPGAWTARVALPGRLEGRQRLDVRARLASATGQAAIVVASGPAAQLTLDPGVTDVLADGDTRIWVRAVASDGFGNPVPEPPIVTADLGALSDLAPSGTGSWRVLYRPPRLEGPATETLRARVGETEAAIPLALLPRVPPLRLSPRVGAVLRTGGSVGPYAGVEASWWPRAFRGAGALALEGGWSSFSRQDAVDAGAATAQLKGSAQFFPVLLGGLWCARLGARTTLQVGAGAGLVLVASSVALEGLEGTRETAWVPEVHTALGLGQGLGAGRAVLEVRLAWQADPRLDTLRGAVSSITLDLGYSLDLL